MSLRKVLQNRLFQPYPINGTNISDAENSMIKLKLYQQTEKNKIAWKL